MNIINLRKDKADMKNYLFKTTTTVKDNRQNKNVWIDSEYIPDITIKADSLKAALKEYQKKATNDYYMNISDNALKNLSGMYRDTPDGSEQIGIVLTGSTDITNYDTYKTTLHYFDLWVEIIEVNYPNFSEAV